MTPDAEDRRQWPVLLHRGQDADYWPRSEPTGQEGWIHQRGPKREKEVTSVSVPKPSASRSRPAAAEAEKTWTAGRRPGHHCRQPTASSIRIKSLQAVGMNINDVNNGCSTSILM